MISLSVIEQQIVQGIYSPTLLTEPLVKGQLGYTYLHTKHIPTMASLYKKDPPKTKTERAAWLELENLSAIDPYQVVFTSSGTPPQYVAALAVAAKSALDNPTIEQEENAQGITNGAISPADTARDLAKEINSSSAMKPYLPYIGSYLKTIVGNPKSSAYSNVSPMATGELVNNRCGYAKQPQRPHDL